MAMIAGLMLVPVVGIAAAASTFAHMQSNEPYDPNRFVVEGSECNGHDAGAEDVDVVPDGFDNSFNNASVDSFDNASDAATARSQLSTAAFPAASRRQHAFHVSGKTQRQFDSHGRGSNLAACRPPVQSHGWPVGKYRSADPAQRRVNMNAKVRRRVPPSMLTGFGASNIVSSARRSSKLRARQRTANFFKVREYGGLFRDPQGNVFRQFQNRTDWTPDREYNPGLARRHDYVSIGPVQPNTLVDGAEPRTNPMPRPHYEVSNMSREVRARAEAQAQTAMATVTDGLTPDGKGAEVNQQAPAGFIGGYDTTMFDSNINLGTTTDAQASQRRAGASDFVEQHIGGPNVTTINTMETAQRRAAVDAADAATYNNQTGAEYTTVGALDVSNRRNGSANVTDSNVADNAWTTFTEVRKSDPTRAPLRLTEDFDAVASTGGASAAAQQTFMPSNTLVISQRQPTSVETIAGSAGTDIGVGQQTLLRTSNDWHNRTQQQVASISAVDGHGGDVGGTTALLRTTLGTTQRQNVASASSEPWLATQVQGVNNISDGDNVQRRQYASGVGAALADRGIGTQLMGLNTSDGDNRQTSTGASDWSTVSNFSGTLGTLNTVGESQRYAD